MLNHRGGTESDLTVSRLAPSSQASALAPAFEGERCPAGGAVLGFVAAAGGRTGRAAVPCGAAGAARETRGLGSG